MAIELIDYRTELRSNNDKGIEGKWISCEYFNGIHVEGVAYVDNRRNICVHSHVLRDSENDKIFERVGIQYHVSPFVIESTIRVIEPFSAPRAVLIDNTMLSGEIKENINSLEVKLLDGRTVTVPMSAVKYVDNNVIE